MKIAIIGGGITGLSAAYRLTQLGADDLTLFETRNRVGGVLSTCHESGFQIEESADNFITTVPWGVNLCRELGIEDELVQTNPQFRRTYVVRKGGLHLLPDGFLMLAPTKLWPMATTPILSPLGKFRAGLELFVKARRDDGDESLADFARRRLGREVFERLIEPLVSGVYAADMEKLSVMATLPRFREMEREHGSLILAMQKQLSANRAAAKRAAKSTAKSAATDAAKQSNESGARYSMFVTLRSGLSFLCEKLASQLPPATIRLGCQVTKIVQNENGKWLISFSSDFSQSEANVQFDAVILATPSYESASLLQESKPIIAEKFAQISHEGTAITTFGFDDRQIKQKIRGMGFVVPKIEKSPILAGSFSSLKYIHRAPAGKQLIRVFAGGARAPEFAEMPDERIVPILLAELKKVVKIEGEPLFTKTSHWPRTMPQYHVGHRELISDIQKECQSDTTLALAGNAFHGVGVPNCIRSGFDAAEKIGKML
ncbi:MAG: protoporphyrinogen oxidase [Thermoguttaceae bacterium]